MNKTVISFLTKTASLFIALSIPLLLLLGSIRILTSDAYLSFEYNRPGFPPDQFGFSTSERYRLGSAGLQYVRDPLPARFLADQNIGEQPAFDERELSHMKDVQNVFQMAWRTGFAILVILMVSLIILVRRPKTDWQLASILHISGFTTTGVITLIGFLAVVGWQQWFTVFHTLFFLPGTWTFAFTDTLIRLYPMQFWFDSVLLVSGITLVGGLIIGFTGWAWKSRIV